MTSQRDPVTTAIFKERVRCARILARTITSVCSPEDQPVQKAVDSVIRRTLNGCAEQIMAGMAPPPRKKSRRRTCSYCLGDAGDGHNRATCPQRFADLAKGAVS